MLSIIKSIALNGLSGYLVQIQVDVSPGLPSFEIVGLPDTSIKESKERVRIAIKNSHADFLSRRITINLAPANTRKEGSIFDLPIAVGILVANGDIRFPDLDKILDETIFVGELSLDGGVQHVNGILPICIEAKNLGIKRIILPKENAKEASVVNDIEIIPISTLNEIIDYLNGSITIPQVSQINFESNLNSNYPFDFADVKGQENVKRALEVSAAGFHNCILIGSPGSGKTMLSRCLPSILPDLSFNEALEITKIHSIAGLLSSDEPLICTRPFRSPHHTITQASLVGGGKSPKPGEISLSHCGVLFLDELTEFNKSTLELLRGPLEDRFVTISRLNSTVTYPCNFMFVASMNPCPFGYYGSNDKQCSCTSLQIQKYINKISGPLLDRIDIHIEVDSVKYDKLELSSSAEDSKSIRARVNMARRIQVERYKDFNIFSNAELTPKLIKNFCQLNLESKEIMKSAFENLGLSARAYNRILKVARTIADLDNSKNIKTSHLAESIQYRSLDRKYWLR